MVTSKIFISAILIFIIIANIFFLSMYSSISQDQTRSSESLRGLDIYKGHLASVLVSFPNRSYF